MKDAEEKHMFIWQRTHIGKNPPTRSRRNCNKPIPMCYMEND